MSYIKTFFRQISNSLLFFLLLLSFSIGALSLLSLWLFLLLLALLLLLLVALGRALVVGLGVDGLADLEGGVLKSFESFFDLFDVLGNDGLVQGGDVTLDLVLNVLRDACTVLLDLLLGVVDVLVGLVLDVDDLLGSLVGLLRGLRIDAEGAVVVHVLRVDNAAKVRQPAAVRQTRGGNTAAAVGDPLVDRLAPP